MRRWVFFSGAALLFAAVVLNGCRSTEDSSDQTADEKRKKIVKKVVKKAVMRSPVMVVKSLK